MRDRILSSGLVLVLLLAVMAVTGTAVEAVPAPVSSALPGERSSAALPSTAVLPQRPRATVPARGLKVKVSAPEDVRPKVRVTGPNGWARTIHATTHFRRAPVGRYRVKASTRRFAEGKAVPRVLDPRPRVRRNKGALARVRYDTVIAPETTVVPEGKIEDLTVQTDGTQVLEVAGPPTAAVGAVVVTGVSPETPTGLVSRVQSVEEAADTTQYTVVPAKLTDAFTDLALNEQITIDLDGTAAVSARTGERIVARGLSSVIECDSGASFNVTRSMTGSISLRFSAAYRATNPAGSVLRAEASANVSAKLGANMDAAGSCVMEKLQLGPTVQFTPITFSIGPVPVVIVPTLKFFGEAKASLETAAGIDVTASIATRAWAQASLSGGVSHGFDPPTADLKKAITYPQDVNGELSGELSARLTTELYGVAGPHVEIKTGPRVTFAPTQVPWLNAEQVLSVDMGLNLQRCAQLWGADLCVNFEAEVDDVVRKTWSLYRRDHLAEPSITSTELPVGVRGQPYTATLTTADNRQGAWRISSGSLPGGLALSGKKIQGTPSNAGSSTFTIRFTDADGRSDDQQLTLTVMSPANAETAAAYRGKIARLSDGTSFYVDKRGGKHHIPDGGVYECLTAQGVEVLDATVAVTGTMPTYEDAECVRAERGNLIATDDGDSYLINGDWSRSWIPSPGDFMCLAANGHSVVRSVPRYYVDDLPESSTRATMDCYSASGVNGKVVRASDGSSWYVDLRGGKHHIPDGGTFECIAAQRGTYGYTVPREWLTQPEYENAACVRAQPGNVIRHSDGDAYVINGDWTRSWIPDAVTYACFVAANGLVDNVPRYYIDDLTAQPANAGFPGRNCILRRSDGASFFVNNEGAREWIPDTPTWDCEIGRGIRVLGPSDGFTNSLGETGWHYCLNMANLRNKVLRFVDDGASYFIHGNDTKTWIPDEFTYNCRTRQGYPVVNTRWRAYIDAFGGSEWDYCFDINTFRNRLIRHDPGGDIHFVGDDGRRHWVPGDRAACMQGRFGAPATVRWREYIDARIPEGDWAICGDTLYRNQNLDRGQWLASGNNYRLVMQTDGNLVIYNPRGTAIWNLGASSTRKHMRLHDDGCLASVRYDNEWDWSAGCGQSADRLVMQSDGNLVLYRGSTATWASNTVGR